MFPTVHNIRFSRRTKSASMLSPTPAIYSSSLTVTFRRDLSSHRFLNARCSGEDGSDMKSRLQSLVKPENLRGSAGIGVVAPMPIGRFEINLVAPLDMGALASGNIITDSRGNGGVSAQLRWAIDSEFS